MHDEGHWRLKVDEEGYCPWHLTEKIAVKCHEEGISAKDGFGLIYKIEGDDRPKYVRWIISDIQYKINRLINAFSKTKN